MKYRIRQGLFLFFIISAVSLSCFTYSFGQPGNKNSEPPKDKQIIIESNNLEIDDHERRITFTGEVRAEGNEFTITCQKLELYYHQQQQADPEKPTKIDIKKIVATGQVEILRPDAGTVSAETAVYFQAEEKVVLTGHPRIKQENDFVEGTRITLFLKDKKSIVEGSEGNQVKAVVRIPESE